MEISQREREGIVLLDLKGRLVAGDACTEIRELTRSLQAAGHLRIILNLEHLDYIDSTGLGSLVICFTSVQKAGGALKLANLNRRNLELLVLTKLTMIFEVFNDEQDAVNSFFPDRKVRKFDILSFVKGQQEE